MLIHSGLDGRDASTRSYFVGILNAIEGCPLSYCTFGGDEAHAVIKSKSDTPNKQVIPVFLKIAIMTLNSRTPL